jgi:uncharacterized damage-inducible protein DinB
MSKETTMPIAAVLLPEFDHEMTNTRRTLERVPDGRFDWKPHDKSTALGSLASHLSNIPSWVALAIGQDSLDLAPPGEEPKVQAPAANTAELLAAFDKNVAAAREALAPASDELLMQPWTLLKGGTELLTLPRAGILRSFVLNHVIHHRAQLGVYLRLLDVPVPSIYGPSADEAGF